jgi:hypothetical protein
VSFFKDRLIVFEETHPVPSLLDFWIRGGCKFVVIIYLFKDFRGQITLTFSQSIQEDQLGFFLEFIESLEVFWRLLSLIINVSQG